MRKKSIIFLFVLFPLVIGLACRFSSKPDPTATPTEEPIAEVTTEPVEKPTKTIETQEPEGPASRPPQGAGDIAILEPSAWYQDDSEVFFGYLFENQSADVVYEGVEFTIGIYGVSGNLIDSSVIRLPFFYPGTTHGIATSFWLSDEDAPVDDVDISWTFTGKSSPGTSENPFTAESVVFWENRGYPLITGKIVNNSSNIYTDLRADILLYNAAGDVVGGGSTYLDFILADDYMGFTTFADAYDEVVRVEAFPTFNYSVSIMDEADYMYGVSVVEDQYREGDFGSLEGGLIIKNETDIVLRNIYVYVTFYDEDGFITTTGSDYVNLLLPGDTLGLSPWITSQPDETTTTNYDILLLPFDKDDNYELDKNPFRVDNITLTGDSSKSALVEFTNTYSKEVTEVDVYVLAYNEEGEIVGGGDTWTSDSISSGGTGEVEVWISYDYSETIDYVEAWVTPSYWTKFK